MSSRVTVFCEDSYGPRFLRNLVAWLKSIGLIDNSVGLDCLMFYHPCNPKLENQLLAKSGLSSRFVVLVDTDGHPKLEVENRVRQHIPQSFRDITRLVIFDYEIEDWICVGLGIQITGKTYEIMKKEFYYEKFRLPSYATKLDINKLKTCKSFMDFLESFSDL